MAVELKVRAITPEFFYLSASASRSSPVLLCYTHTFHNFSLYSHKSALSPLKLRLRTLIFSTACSRSKIAKLNAEAVVQRALRHPRLG
jgi:hypothetical protein